jgi:hypothetical protein
MATEKIRVGIIGANVRNGWGRDAHIPALRALPEFEITAVSASRQGIRPIVTLPGIWRRRRGPRSTRGSQWAGRHVIFADVLSKQKQMRVSNDQNSPYES